jgi:hypothetical protein
MAGLSTNKHKPILDSTRLDSTPSSAPVADKSVEGALKGEKKTKGKKKYQKKLFNKQSFLYASSKPIASYLLAHFSLFFSAACYCHQLHPHWLT